MKKNIFKKMHVVKWGVLALLCMGAVSAGNLQVRQAWEQLGSSVNGCPDEFDYFPDGGLRIFYCHAKQFVDYQDLQQMVGMRAFRSGPHSREELDLDAYASFGHYNPAFVKALGNILIPEDPQFIALTQSTYDNYIRDLARTFFVSHEKLQANRHYLEQEADAYMQRLKAREEAEDENSIDDYYLDKYFFFMNPDFFAYENKDDYFYRHGFDGGWNGNVVKTCVGFWLRRHIDGTSDEFYQNLQRLLKAYDFDFYIENRMVNKAQ